MIWWYDMICFHHIALMFFYILNVDNSNVKIFFSYFTKGYTGKWVLNHDARPYQLLLNKDEEGRYWWQTLFRTPKPSNKYPFPTPSHAIALTRAVTYLCSQRVRCWLKWRGQKHEHISIPLSVLQTKSCPEFVTTDYYVWFTSISW